MRWGFWLFMAVWFVVYIVRDVKKQRVYERRTVPQQLVQLVQQAQSGQSFQTQFDFHIGADMREKLCYPLTPEQVELIRTTPSSDCQWKQFSYRLAEYKYNDRELSGVVLSTIRFQDDSRNINLDYKDVPLRICCMHRMGKGYHLDSVERM